MKRIVTLIVVLAFMVSGLAAVALAEDKATPKEVVEKVKEAVALIQEKGDEGIAAVQDKNGPFVWKDAYLFVLDFDGKMLAHPMNPALVGRNMMGVKDTKGKLFNAEIINIAKNNGQGWGDYYWVKPGEKEPSLKASFVMAVPGKNMCVGGGIYDINAADAEKAAQ